MKHFDKSLQYSNILPQNIPGGSLGQKLKAGEPILVSFRCPKKIVREIEDIAKEQRRSRTDQIIFMLERQLELLKKK